MRLIKECNCPYSKKCKYIKKMFGALYNLEDTYPSITEFDFIIVDQSQKKFWNGDISEDEYSFRISCGLLKNYSFEHLKWVLVKVYFENRLNELDDIEENCTGDCRDENIQYCDDCRCSEECCESCREENNAWAHQYREADNLTRAAMRLEKVRKIAYPIEIVQDRDVNGMADDDRGKILITSAAAEQLSEAELAFVISHEEAHLQGEHRKKSREFREFCKEKSKEVMNDEKSGNFAKGIVLSTIVAASAVNVFVSPKLHEIEADCVAKERMLEAGYSKRDVTKFFDNYPGGRWGLLKPHPPQSFRKEILE